MDGILLNIGIVLRAWRCHEELTLKEASGRIGIPLQTLDSVERGRWHAIKGETMWKIMMFLFDRKPALT